MGVVCLIAGLSGEGGAQTRRLALVIGVVMIVFSVWAAWRRH
jgi:hypothetical protein